MKKRRDFNLFDYYNIKKSYLKLRNSSARDKHTLSYA